MAWTSAPSRKRSKPEPEQRIKQEQADVQPVLAQRPSFAPCFSSAHRPLQLPAEHQQQQAVTLSDSACAVVSPALGCVASM